MIFLVISLVCSVLFVNSDPKIFRLSLGCHPLDGVTQGGPPPSLPSDATASLPPPEKKLKMQLPVRLMSFRLFG